MPSWSILKSHSQKLYPQKRPAVMEIGICSKLFCSIFVLFLFYFCLFVTITTSYLKQIPFGETTTAHIYLVTLLLILLLVYYY